MKDAPAFDFFPERWLAGVAALSDAEQLAFLRLLCHQWLAGDCGLTPDIATLKRLAGKGVTAALLAKFPVGEDGQRRNARLEAIRREQRERILSKRFGSALTNAKRHGIGSLNPEDRALVEGSEKWKEHLANEVASDTKARSLAGRHHPPPTTHPEVQNIRESKERSIPREQATPKTPTLEQVKAWADRVMASPECAECFFNDHEARPITPEGLWTDRHGIPVSNPESAFRSFVTRWKANEAQRRQANGNRPRSLQRDAFDLLTPEQASQF